MTNKFVCVECGISCDDTLSLQSHHQSECGKRRRSIRTIEKNRQAALERLKKNSIPLTADNATTETTPTSTTAQTAETTKSVTTTSPTHTEATNTTITIATATSTTPAITLSSYVEANTTADTTVTTTTETVSKTSSVESSEAKFFEQLDVSVEEILANVNSVLDGLDDIDGIVGNEVVSAPPCTECDSRERQLADSKKEMDRIWKRNEQLLKLTRSQEEKIFLLEESVQLLRDENVKCKNR